MEGDIQRWREAFRDGGRHSEMEGDIQRWRETFRDGGRHSFIASPAVTELKSDLRFRVRGVHSWRGLQVQCVCVCVCVCAVFLIESSDKRDVEEMTRAKGNREKKRVVD